MGGQPGRDARWSPAGQETRRLNRILLVDDNEQSVECLAQILDLWGYQTQVANDGVKAIERAREFCPDVILLDIGLPGMDGIAVARTLRGADWFDGTAVLAMSGRRAEDVLPEGGTNLFDGHLVKPVELDDLREI